MTETFLNGRVTLHVGDCLDVLAAMPENSVDSVVCDPPYPLASIVKRFGAEGAAPCKPGTDGAYARASVGFMGKAWDGGDIAFRPDTWARVLRVLKPGGYILAFSSSRTFGRMSVAMEDAGFITHPMIGWIFGSGFPKATRLKAEGYQGQRYGAQALKPALEPIYMGQKPFSEDTGTANVLRWGTGAVNIDVCRVGDDGGCAGAGKVPKGDVYGDGLNGSFAPRVAGLGRWPANLIHDGSDEVVEAFPAQAGGGDLRGVGTGRRPGGFGNVGHTNGDGEPCSALYADAGSAARFFYSAKADEYERAGSAHPTVKPQSLLRYLARLITPKGGTVLDCFAGTGSTGQAAYHEGYSAVLIEREPEYQADIRRRMALVMAGPDERRHAIIKAKGKPVDLAGTLFAPPMEAAE